MSDLVIVTPGASYPQTTDSPTRGALKAEIALYVAGSDDPDTLDRAEVALKQALDEYDARAWKFARFVEDISLVTLTNEYSLHAQHRSKVNAVLLNASDQEVSLPLGWYEYREYLAAFPDQTAPINIPEVYTARNHHEEGKVIFGPGILTSPFPYPKVRITYHRWISRGAGDAARVDAPRDVIGGIRMLAIAKLLAMKKGYEDAQGAFAEAAGVYNRVEQEHRDYEDF